MQAQSSKLGSLDVSPLQSRVLGLKDAPHRRRGKARLRPRPGAWCADGPAARRRGVSERPALAEAAEAAAPPRALPQLHDQLPPPCLAEYEPWAPALRREPSAWGCDQGVCRSQRIRSMCLWPHTLCVLMWTMPMDLFVKHMLMLLEDRYEQLHLLIVSCQATVLSSHGQLSEYVLCTCNLVNYSIHVRK